MITPSEAADGDRDQRAEHSRQVRAHQHRDDRHHRVHLQRPAAVHQRLDHAVLQLLVGEEDREPQQRVIGLPVDRQHGGDQDAADREPDQRHQVEEGDQQRHRDRQVEAQNLQEDPGEQPRPDRQQHVDADVGAHDGRDARTDPAGPVSMGSVEAPRPALEHPLPSSSRKTVSVRIVTAASRCSSTLTVALPSSVAPSPSFEGRLLACSDSFEVRSYFSFSSANSCCPRPRSRSPGRRSGTSWPGPRRP